MAITVVIPSRGRPQRARQAIEAIRDSAVRADTSVVLAVDEDDPCLPDYRAMVDALRPPNVGSERRPTLVVLRWDETGDLVRATNTVSMRIARDDPSTIIANFGDDHIARTFGWDRIVTEALATPGIAYGDDLIHGERVPTAPFISGAIVMALGWYALPTCRHLYIDDAWRELGKAAGILRYLPDVIVEHLHPAVQKADWDEGYERANNKRVVDHDHAAYLTWLRSPLFRADLSNVTRAVRRAA